MEEILKAFLAEKFYECRSVEYGKNTDKSLYVCVLRGLNGVDIKLNITDGDDHYNFTITRVKGVGPFYGLDEIVVNETFQTEEELTALLDKHFNKSAQAISNKSMFDIYTAMEEYLGTDNIKKSVVVENNVQLSTEDLVVDVRRIRDRLTKTVINKVDIEIVFKKDNLVRLKAVNDTSAVGKIKHFIEAFYSDED